MLCISKSRESRNFEKCPYSETGYLGALLERKNVLGILAGSKKP